MGRAAGSGSRGRLALVGHPYAAHLTALRFVPARLVGVLMSVHPVFAAFAGLVILGQRLAVHEWLGIGIVVGVKRAGQPPDGWAGRPS